MTKEQTISNLRKLKSFHNGSYGADIDRAIKALEQEPKTGHWTYIRNSEVNGLKIVKCSKCGKRTYGSGNYCPNCGACMKDCRTLDEFIEDSKESEDKK